MSFELGDANNNSDNTIGDDQAKAKIIKDVSQGLFEDYVEDNTYHVAKSEIKNYKDESDTSGWVKILAIVVVVGLILCFAVMKHKEATKYDGFYSIETFIYEGETMDSAGFFIASGDISFGNITIEKDKCELFICRDADISSVRGTVSIKNREIRIDKNDIHIVGEYNPDDESITIVKDDVTYIFYKTAE